MPALQDSHPPREPAAVSTDGTAARREADEMRDVVSGLREQLARAEAALQARDEFLSIAAHELRTPMNALALQLSAIERLARREGDGQITRELQRARRMIDRYVRRAVVLLDVSRLNSGHFVIQPQRIDLRELVSEVAEAHAEEAAFREVEMRVEVDDALVGWWDPQALDAIISNLLSNAFKYAAGAPLTISAQRDGETRVRLAVADTGPGIDARDRARIFEKFERVVGTGRAQSGFGLGLWIVARLVAAHGGSIHVESEAGAGSCFTIVLPLHPPGSASPSGSSS
jgi:signal transduction histidine kinase